MAIAINFFQPLGHISPEAALISFGAYMVLFVPFAILFWLRRQKEPLKSRSAFLVLFQLSFMSIVYFCYALSTYFYFAPTPDYGYACQLMYWVSSGFVPLGVFPYVVRGMRLYIQYMRGNLMVADNRIATGLPHDLKHMEMHRWVTKTFKWFLFRTKSALFVSTYWGICIIVTLGVYFGSMDLAVDDWCNSPQYGFLFLGEILALNFVAFFVILLVWSADARDAFSIRNELVMVLVVNGVFSSLAILAIFEVIPINYTIFIFLCTWFMLVVSLVWPVLQSYVHENMIESFIKRNAKQQDPSKFKSSTSFMPRSVSLFFMRRLGRVGVTNITVDTDSDKDTTNNTELSSVMSLASPDDTITATSPGTIEKGKAITVTTIHLTDLIRDPVECDRLQTLSIQCFSAELVLFCVDLEKYRDKVAARPLAEHFSAAASMIDRYIIEGGSREININDDTRKMLTAQFKVLRTRYENGTFVSDDDHELLSNLFNNAEFEVKGLIKTNILPLWRPAPQH